MTVDMHVDLAAPHCLSFSVPENDNFYPYIGFFGIAQCQALLLVCRQS